MFEVRWTQPGLDADPTDTRIMQSPFLPFPANDRCSARRATAALCVCGSLALPGPLLAQEVLKSSTPESASACHDISLKNERLPTLAAGSLGLGLVLDEHLLVNGPRDEDYSGGGEIILTGHDRVALARGLERAVDGLTEKLCPVRQSPSNSWTIDHAMAIGLIVFTPKDLTSRQVVRNDRPYASLFFVSIGRRQTDPSADVAYDAFLSLGFLGLKAADTVQSGLHRITGSVAPEGWSHQVSAGGEPTARYELDRQALLAERGGAIRRVDVKWSAATSIGTVTEADIALNARAGHLRSPWWAFAPEETMYVPEPHPPPPPLPADDSPEFFTFAGGRVKLRVYNAFLQGQFRHSDLRYRFGDLEPLLGELWAGVVYRPGCRWNTQLAARWESPELKSGVGSRSFVWGSIDVSRSLL